MFKFYVIVGRLVSSTGSDPDGRILRIMSDLPARKPDFTRRLMLIMAMLLTIAATASFGPVRITHVRAQAKAENATQSIADTWQGTLHPGRDLRIVVKISKADDGGYKSVFYVIDQNGDEHPATKTTLDGSNLKLILPMGGTYEGKLSGDGKTITGTWTTMGPPLPLTLTRATPETEWTIPPPAPKIPPMDANVSPNFEVATIKPNDSGAPRMQGLTVNGRNFRTVNSSLGDLITFSFGVHAKQVVNAPDWTDKNRYDIAAVPEQEGTPNPEQVRIMIQKLLADRFKLTFHHDKRELPAYLLTLGKSGSKLTPIEERGPLPGFGIGPGTGGLTLRAMNTSLPEFARFLQLRVLDRPVVDQTGLTGKYDFQCTFTPDESQFNGRPPLPPQQQQTEATNAAPSLYDALQQLGMKLSAEKVPVDVIVIDHVEKPSEN
jgi:uncharacterized protein (TIGR03435 family)